MKQCSRCARENPDWALACDCGQRFEAPDDQTRSEAAPPETLAAAVPASSPAPRPSGMGRRELLMLAVAVLGGGTVTLAMLISSGSADDDSSTPAADAPAVVRRAGDAAPSSSAAPTWETTTADWVADPRKGVAFEVRSENRVPIWQRSAHPVLVVRCFARQTDVFVFIESAAKMERQDANHTVGLTFDNEAELTERWPDSDEHDALFAPDGRAFAGRLASARTLKFGYTPHNADPVVATFHVAGLADLMAPSKKHCAQ